MKNKTWDSENFKRDSKLIDKLYNSPIYNPTHKQTIINPVYKDWKEYKDSKWIYEGFFRTVSKLVFRKGVFGAMGN